MSTTGVHDGFTQVSPRGYRPACRDRDGREPSGQAAGQRGHRASLGLAPDAGDSGSSSWCSATVGSVAPLGDLPRPCTARVLVTSLMLALTPSTRLIPSSLRLTRPQVPLGSADLIWLWCGPHLERRSPSIGSVQHCPRPRALYCSSQEWMCRRRVRLLRCTSPIRARMSSSALMASRM